MKHIYQQSRLSCFSMVAGALLSGTILLTGCGIGEGTAVISPISETPLQSNSSVSGILHGGPNPISSANVILWATQSDGYPSSTNDTTGTTSLKLATATTDGGGNFSFTAGSFTCPSGQFAYITATGGNSGAGANSQIVLMAALGSCSHFDNTTDENNIRIWISEATTVAAAYALGNFMYVNDNGGTGNQLVYISAPANNNATTGSCTGTGSSMTCTAAGLAHAFANAANLVDAVHYDGTTPTGLPFSVPPSNPTYGTVPAAEINALANTLQACTNTTGGTGSTTNCGKLFTDATPSSSTNGSTAAPVDELQAIMDIAKSPTHNVAALFNLASSTIFFLPTLTTAPTDWSLAIMYAPVTVGAGGTAFTATLSTSPIAITGYSITSNVVTFTASNTLASGEQVFVYGFPTSTFLNGVAYQVSSTICGTPPCSTFTASLTHANVSTTTESGSAQYDYPVWLALDANDNVYSANTDASANGGGMSAFAANGTPNWTAPLSYTYCNPTLDATDTNGNAWLMTAQSSGSCGGSKVNLVAFSDASGSTVNGTPWGASTTPGYVANSNAIAFDRSNNLWIGGTSCTSSSTCVWHYNYNTGDTNNYATSVAITDTLTSGLTGYINYMLVDSDYNVWTSSNGTSYTADPIIGVVPNNNTVASPTWTASALTSTMAEGRNNGVALDSYNNAWATSYDGTGPPVVYTLNEATPTYTGPTVTSLPTSASAEGSIPTTTSPYKGEFDGAGTFWYGASNASANGAIYYYLPTPQTYVSLTPCFLPHAATACVSTPRLGIASPGVVQVDSTGSIWVAAKNGGQIVQIIGSAAPTWPQLSYAVFGAMPQ